MIFYFWEFIQAIFRDLIGAKKLLTIKLRIRQFEKTNSNIPETFYNLANKHPKKPCIIFNDQTWTFQQVKINTFFD